MNSSGSWEIGFPTKPDPGLWLLINPHFLQNKTLKITKFMFLITWRHNFKVRYYEHRTLKRELYSFISFQFSLHYFFIFHSEPNVPGILNTVMFRLLKNFIVSNQCCVSALVSMRILIQLSDRRSQNNADTSWSGSWSEFSVKKK